MNKALISLMIVLMFFVGSCGGGDDSEYTEPCTDADIFCHFHGGLNWSDASSSSMYGSVAVEYCGNLGGRLPTISELRTLIKNCPVTETGGECGVTDSCLSGDCWHYTCDGCEYDKSGLYSVFGDISSLWSSSEQSVGGGYAWYVSFYVGSVGFGTMNHKFDVRCVK